MRRWNGWGDEEKTYPLTESAAFYLAHHLGLGSPTADVSLKKVVQQVPVSRLPDRAWINCQPEMRVRHALGQSLPDWVALRMDRIPVFPDGVAFPESAGDVRTCLDFAYDVDVNLIPYGGGTSVVGHINPIPGERPNLCVDLSRLNRLVSLDEDSHLATFEAGVSGPVLEKQLNAQGFT